MDKILSRSPKDITISILIFSSIFTLGLVARLSLLQKAVAIGLHIDEIQSVTHAILPVKELIQSVGLYDPHPPVYYLQLHAWMYLGNGDLWLKLNSVLWSVLTLISLCIIARRIFNLRVAILVGAFYSVAAFSISYSVEVRMYAFLMFLGVWIYYFTHQFINERNRIWTGIGLGLTQLAFLYSHGVGFLIYLSVVSYAILYVIMRDGKAVINKWTYIWLGAIQLLILALYLPWLNHANTIYPGHALVPSWSDLAYSFAQLLFGTKIMLVKYREFILVFAVIVMLILTFMFLIHKKSRVISISFIFVPIVASIVISYMFRPIWVTWSLAYILPFICLGIAIVASDILWSAANVNTVTARQWGVFIVIGIIFFSSIAGMIFQQFNYPPWNHMKDAVGVIKQNADSTDIIYVPNKRLFWGVSWYYLGPGSFNPLEPNYLLSSKDGVRLASMPALHDILGKGTTYWVVYREEDNVGAFFDEIIDSDRLIVSTFKNVVVERVSTTNH